MQIILLSFKDKRLEEVWVLIFIFLISFTYPKLKGLENMENHRVSELSGFFKIIESIPFISQRS